MENALKQYIDLFNSRRGDIESHSCAPLNEHRAKAFGILENAELPRRGSEDFENTDLQAMLAPNYGINIDRLNLGANPSASFKCGVPNMSTALFLTLDDVPAETRITQKNIPEGVVAGSLRAIAKSHPCLLERYYGKVADINNPLVSLNTLLVQDGFMIYIPKNLRIVKPLQIVNIFQGNLPMMAVRRLLIVVEEGAEATVISCDHTQNPDHRYLSLQTIEIFAGRGSHVDFYDMEESTEKTSRLSTLYLHQEADSNVLIDGITLYNGTTRNEYFCRFKGENGALKLLGMAIESNERKIESHTEVDHAKGHCHSDQLFKYVAQDSAIASFAGRIKVDYGAVKTEAYQASRNIVDSDTAKVFSKPQLEIYNDDVKCSHGTAIGQLDEMQLFYMRTRGLDEATARQLLKQAFMTDVIDGVRYLPLRDRLHVLTEQRFAGIMHNCADCGATCQSKE